MKNVIVLDMLGVMIPMGSNMDLPIADIMSAAALDALGMVIDAVPNVEIMVSSTLRGDPAAWRQIYRVLRDRFANTPIYDLPRGNKKDALDHWVHRRTREKAEYRYIVVDDEGMGGRPCCMPYQYSGMVAADAHTIIAFFAQDLPAPLA